VASDTSNIRIFDISSGDVTHVLDWHQTSLLSKLGRKTVKLSSSRDGFLASGGADGTVSVFEKGGFEKRFHKTIGRGEITALEFSHNGEFLAVADARGKVCLLKSPDFEVVQELKHPSVTKAVSFSHDMRLLATGATDSQIRLFYLNNGKELEKLSHHAGGILDLDFDDSEPKLVSVGNDRRLFVTYLRW